MATPEMKPIRVHIMGREYALRVRKGEEDTTRKLASQVNARMKAFKNEHPEQDELTTSVITALAMTEEINDLRAELAAARNEAQSAADQERAVHDLLTHLSGRLSDALPAGALPVPPEDAPPTPDSDPATDAHAGDAQADTNADAPAGARDRAAASSPPNTDSTPGSDGHAGTGTASTTPVLFSDARSDARSDVSPPDDFKDT